MDDNRDFDKKLTILPSVEDNAPRSIQRTGVSVDVIKSLYIASGLNAEEIAEQTYLPVEKIKELINNYNLPELRKAYIVEGIQKIQNVQLQQSNKLMDLENDFKKLRIVQLEAQLQDFLAYYARHGDFYKRHPTTGDILKDTNGIPMQLKLPNVTREIQQLKEAVTMSEGVRSLLHRLDEIINTGQKKENINDVDSSNIIEADYSAIFKDVDSE